MMFLGYQRDTGHPHPHRDAQLNNDAILLREMSRSEVEIAAEIQALMREAGLGRPFRTPSTLGNSGKDTTERHENTKRWVAGPFG